VTRYIYDDPEDKRPSWTDEVRAPKIQGVLLARLTCECGHVVAHVDHRAPDPDSPAARAGVVGPVLVWEERDLYIRKAADGTLLPGEKRRTRAFADPLSNVGTPQRPAAIPYVITCRRCRIELVVSPDSPEFRSQLVMGKVATLPLQRKHNV